MIGQKNLLTACFAALLALGLAACGTTGDDAPAAAMMDDNAPAAAMIDPITGDQSWWYRVAMT